MKARWGEGLFACFFVIGVMAAPGVVFGADPEVEELKALVRKQEEVLDQQRQQLDELKDRVHELEAERRSPSEPVSPPVTPVDLSYQEVSPASSEPVPPAERSPVSDEWFRRIHLSGFGAAGIVGTGKDAERSTLGFLNYDAHLFLDATVWKDVSYFVELLAVERGNDAETKSGEMYVHLHDLFESSLGEGFGLKIGRIDIPFGEEYRRQDSVDNRLITNSVNLPYNWDEGVVAYGRFGGLGWVASVMDGQTTRSIDDSRDKATTLKLYGNPIEPLYLSASFLRNGKSAKSALKFAGSHFQPVGRAGGPSVLGTSPSTQVESYAYSLDARYAFPRSKGQLDLSFGQGFLRDDNAAFNRDFLFFTVEPMVQLTPKLYAVSRFSGIGTFDDGEGYHFDGNPFAGGIGDFGDDAKSLLRWAIGLGYQLNPRTRVKLEYSRDDFEVIDSSLTKDSHEDRDLVGAQVVVGF